MCNCLPGYAGIGTRCTPCKEHFYSTFMMRSCMSVCLECPFGFQMDDNKCKPVKSLFVLSGACMGTLLFLLGWGFRALYRQATSKVGVRDLIEELVQICKMKKLVQADFPADTFLPPRVMRKIVGFVPAQAKVVSWWSGAARSGGIQYPLTGFTPFKPDPDGSKSAAEFEGYAAMVFGSETPAPSALWGRVRHLWTLEQFHMQAIRLLWCTTQQLSRYMQMSEGWGDPLLEKIAESNVGEKYQTAYDVVQKIIEGESDRVTKDIHEAAAALAATAVGNGYVDTLDKIALSYGALEAVGPQLLAAYSRMFI